MTQKLPRPLALALAALMAFAGLTVATPASAAFEWTTPNVQVGTHGEFNVALSWTAATDTYAPTYKVAVYDVTKTLMFYEFPNRISGTTLDFPLWPMQRGTEYVFVVTAIHSGGVTELGTAASAKWLFPLFDMTLDKNKANSLAATKGQTNLNVTWAAPSGPDAPISGWKIWIEEGPNADFTGQPEELNAYSTSKNFLNLKSATDYTIGVAAVIGSQTGPAITKTFTTLESPPIGPPTGGPAPIGLTAKETAAGIELKWSLPAGNNHGFYVVTSRLGNTQTQLLTGNLAKASTSFVITGLTPGSYTFAVYADYSSTPGLPPGKAEVIVGVTGGGTNPPASNAPAAPAAPVPARVQGADRYATAAAISQEAFPAGNVPVAYIVAGGSFADSMAAGAAAAAADGPVLTLPGNSIPASVAAELMRLDPEKIVVQAGSSAISDAVASEIKRLAPAQVVILGGTGSVSVTVDSQVKALGFNSIRLGGADRYATSSAITEWVRSTAGYGNEALVATGTNFPDAMTAGALAAVKNAPVMLTNGSCWHVESAATLQRIAPIKLTVLGGSGTQAKSVEAVTVCS